MIIIQIFNMRNMVNRITIIKVWPHVYFVDLIKRFTLLTSTPLYSSRWYGLNLLWENTILWAEINYNLKIWFTYLKGFLTQPSFSASNFMIFEAWGKSPPLPYMNSVNSVIDLYCDRLHVMTHPPSFYVEFVFWIFFVSLPLVNECNI